MSATLQAGYKQTDLGILPEGWQLCTLGDVATIRDGTHQTPKYVAIGVPFYSVENVTSGDYENTKFISEQEHRFLTRSFKIERGDILMTRIGSIGDCKLVDWDVDASFYVSLALLKIKPGFSSIFIAHYSKSASFQREIEQHSLQSAIPRKINLGPISDVRIVLPPPPEQRAIATALSDVDALLAKLDALVAKKRDLKTAAMQQLLSGQTRLPGFSGEWEVRRMKSLGNTYGGLTGKTKVDFGHGRARYIPFMNVMTDTVIDTEWFEAVDVASNEVQNLAQKGDLFFNGSSETPEEVGFCSVLLQDFPDLYLNSFCFGFRFNADAKVNGLFFAYWFRGVKGRETMAVLAQGATRYNIAKSAFLRLELPLPTQAEQTAIATVLSDMDAELAALEARRDKTLALKQGMMQELLTGRIQLDDTQSTTATTP